MKDKPVKWGIKLHKICELESAYAYDFEIYAAEPNFSSRPVNVKEAVHVNNYYTRPDKLVVEDALRWPCLCQQKEAAASAAAHSGSSLWSSPKFLTRFVKCYAPLFPSCFFLSFQISSPFHFASFCHRVAVV